RGDDHRRRPARRSPAAIGPPLAALPGPVLPHQLLARRRHRRRRPHSGRRALWLGAQPRPAPPTHAMSDLALLEPIADGVLRLTLNRPQALNALNRELTTALEAALQRVAARDDVRVLLVCGQGRAFCAGNDIKEMETIGGEAQALATRHAVLMDRFSKLPQVT